MWLYVFIVHSNFYLFQRRKPFDAFLADECPDVTKVEHSNEGTSKTLKSQSWWLFQPASPTTETRRLSNHAEEMTATHQQVCLYVSKQWMKNCKLHMQHTQQFQGLPGLDAVAVPGQNKSTGRAQTSATVSQNLMQTSLSKDASLIKFSRRSYQFFQTNKRHCGKTPYLATLKNPTKNS